MKKILWISVLMMIATIVLASCSNQESLSTEKTSYFLIHSKAFKNGGGMIGLDSSGETTYKQSLKIQNIEKSNLSENIFVAGGSRVNNNILIDEDGKIEEFILLDNPNYSGITAINYYNDNIVAVMNGNIDENTYKNLLVVQNTNGLIEAEIILDIFAKDIMIYEDNAYIIGTYLDVQKDEWHSKIIKYAFATSEITENIIQVDRGYKASIFMDSKVYCSSSDMNSSTKKIDVLDAVSLELLNEINFDEEINGLIADDKTSYIILNSSLYKIDFGTNEKEKLYDFSENSYVVNSIIKNNHIYFLLKNDSITKGNEGYQVGNIIKYSIADKSVISTPINFQEKEYDNLVFFPVG